MIKKNLTYIILFFLSNIGSKVYTQTTADINHLTNKQVWTDYNISYSYNNNTKVYGDIGYRFISTESWHRYILRGAYKFNPAFLQKYNTKSFVEVHTGMGTFYTNNNGNGNNFELRPFQGLKTKWPILPFSEFTHYLRIEERIEHIVNEGIWDFNVRLRYKLKDMIKLKGQYLSKVYIPVSAEVFVNFPKGLQFNDVMRLTAGIGTRPRYNYGFELNASWHNSKDQISGVSSTDDFVIRFRFFHYLQE